MEIAKKVAALVRRQRLRRPSSATARAEPKLPGEVERELRQRFDLFRGQTSAEVDKCEAEAGYAVDTEWLDYLALHTQVVNKATDLNWVHGRVLWALFSRRVKTLGTGDFPVALDTGTARGFSALTLANALIAQDRQGVVLTLDILPHGSQVFSNCLDGAGGPVSREFIWRQWPAEAAMVVALQGDTADVLDRTASQRVCFAFLDAHHEEANVIHEFEWVASRQEVGDMIVFDDVSEALYPGVWRAVESVRRDARYEVRIISSSPSRHYACAVRI